MILTGVTGVDLQATLAAMSSCHIDVTAVGPHHPILCRTGGLYYHDDGRFACDHAEVPPDDMRTRDALNHSIALLIIECAARL